MCDQSSSFQNTGLTLKVWLQKITEDNRNQNNNNKQGLRQQKELSIYLTISIKTKTNYSKEQQKPIKYNTQISKTSKCNLSEAITHTSHLIITL